MMRWLMSMGAVAVGSVAGLAHACPSCASPLEENRQAFVDTTIFLTFLPLIMIGGFIWWLRRKARQLEPPPEIAVPEPLRDLGPFSKER
ncbi:MAG: hypothetical protein O7F08_10965 [Deltaproteobacteria bacterium]|nr:hypothetical protein [Deltaproteobacteria bacterium]